MRMNFAVGISKIEKGNEREICESVDDDCCSTLMWNLTSMDWLLMFSSVYKIFEYIFRMNVQKARDIIYGRRKWDFLCVCGDNWIKFWCLITNEVLSKRKTFVLLSCFCHLVINERFDGSCYLIVMWKSLNWLRCSLHLIEWNRWIIINYSDNSVFKCFNVKKENIQIFVLLDEIWTVGCYELFEYSAFIWIIVNEQLVCT